MPAIASRRTVLGGAFAACVAQPAPSGPRLVRIANNQGIKTPYGAGCRALAEAIRAAPLLSGVLQVEVYDEAELGEELASVRSAVKGTLEIVCSSSSVLGNFSPEAGLLDAPFLFRNAAHARAVLDGEIGQALADKLKTKGVNVLAWAENGVRQMTANKPIRRPADLAGLKLRVPQSEVVIASFRALGADPHPLPFGQVHEALRTGELDAQENPIANIEAGRFADVQKYLSLTRHMYSAAVFIGSSDLLDDLTAAQQSALLACARQGAAASRRFADTAERDGIDRLRALGMTVIDDVDAAAFVAAARPNLLALGEKFGPDLMAQLMRAGA